MTIDIPSYPQSSPEHINSCTGFYKYRMLSPDPVRLHGADEG